MFAKYKQNQSLRFKKVDTSLTRLSELTDKKEVLMDEHTLKMLGLVVGENRGTGSVVTVTRVGTMYRLTR